MRAVPARRAGRAAARRRRPPRAAAAPLPQVSGTLDADRHLASPCASCATGGACRTSTRGTSTICSSRRASCRRRTGCFRWISGAGPSQGRLSEVLGLELRRARRGDAPRCSTAGDIGAEWASYGPGVKVIAEAFVARHQRVGGEARVHVPEEFTAGGLAAGDVERRGSAEPDGRVRRRAARTPTCSARAWSRPSAHAARTPWLPVGAPYRIPAGLEIDAGRPVVGEALRRAGTAPFFLGLAAPVTAPADRGAGSNAWVVSGARSATGAPLLANDPHRAFAHPSLRYLVHLNAPGWNVIGAASPWLPGVVIGHNERVAWGMTAFRRRDIADVYVERVNPSNPHQVEYRGRWVDTTIVRDPIVMKGQAKPFPFEREYTPNGVHRGDRFRAAPGILREVERQRARRRGRAGGAGARSRAIRRPSSARRWRAGSCRRSTWSMRTSMASPAARWRVCCPIRSGWDGALPAPGLVRGVRVARMAQPRRPAARHAAARREASSYRRTRTPRRTNRLVEAARRRTHVHTVDDFKRLQHDTTAWNAGQLVPLLAPLRAERNDVEAARLRLLQWDRRVCRGFGGGRALRVLGGGARPPAGGDAPGAGPA